METDLTSSIFSQKSSRLPEDTVFYAIFPDFSLPVSKSLNPNITSLLQSLNLQILTTISPHTTHYIWQHEPFTLSLSSPSSSIPHLQGKLRFGDNLDDEWFVVFLLFQISLAFPSLSIRVWDTDGEFLLIETAFHLPRWINPENSANRVFIRRGEIHIVPKSRLSSPSLLDSLQFLVNCGEESKASESVQLALRNRLSEYPERARRNLHRVRVRVPVSVAQVLKHEPCLIALAVEGFYDRDIDSMKYAAKMEKFLSQGTAEELVLVSVAMSRAMYAQLVQQTFQAPKCYPMPNRSDANVYMEAELGMKIACGFEMMYQQRLRQGLEGKGSTWDAFKESLERSGYFEGLLPGSKDYRRLMENAEEYYRKSSLFSRASEMMSAPVRRIDEILSLPHSTDDFKGQQIPPSDDDSWLYNGEDELNSALQERQKEMELYDLKHKNKQESKLEQDAGPSSGSNLDDFDLGDISKTMQAFVHEMSTYEGAEVPENRNLKAVELDVDRFIEDMESVMRRSVREDATADVETEEGSSSDMDFDESEEDSDVAEPSGDKDEGENIFMQSYSNALNEELKSSTLKKSFVRANEQPNNRNEDEGENIFMQSYSNDFSSSSGDKDEGENIFMQSYSNALNEELKSSTLKKSFVRANEQPNNRNEGTSNAIEDMDDEFTPVDVDVNLVKSFLDSFASQQGLPGPASNLLGLMGVQLPQDAGKNK